MFTAEKVTLDKMLKQGRSVGLLERVSPDSITGVIVIDCHDHPFIEPPIFMKFRVNKNSNMAAVRTY